MAGSAQSIVIEFDFHAVWIMAIRTLNSFVIHFALDVGAVDVDLVENLPVHVIGGNAHVRGPRLGNLGKEVVVKGGAGMVPWVGVASAGVTLGAGLQLPLVGGVDVRKAEVG